MATSVVPMSIGRPVLATVAISSTTASHFSFSDLYTRSGELIRSIGLLVGMATTSSL